MARDRRGRFINPVALLADADSAGRFGPWIEALLVSLVDEGLTPVLISPDELQLGRGLPEQAVVRMLCPRPAWGPLRPLVSHRMLSQLMDEPLRMIVALSGRQADYAVWLAEKINLPLIVLVTGQDEVSAGAAAGRHAYRVFAASGLLLDEVRRYIGAEHQAKAEQISLGVHLGERVAAFADPDRSAGILAVGPLEPASRFDQLIRAFAALNERRYDAAFFIVGSGPAEGDLRALAVERGLIESLTFVGELRRLSELYRGIDVFVQPFVHRRLDLRILEAMSAGMAVLARNGGAMDFVRDGVNGIELTRCDEAELTAVLQRLLDDQALGRRLGSSAHEYIREHHLAGATVQPLVTCIKELVLTRQTLHLPGK